jgi:hypothetical protein
MKREGMMHLLFNLSSSSDNDDADAGDTQAADIVRHMQHLTRCDEVTMEALLGGGDFATGGHDGGAAGSE